MLTRTNLRATGIGLGRAHHDGRRSGFWLGVLVTSVYYIASYVGFGWAGLILGGAVVIAVHTGRPS